MEETQSQTPAKAAATPRRTSAGDKVKPMLMSAVSMQKEPRVKTDLGELDRVLGGGIVPGSLILIGGDPGIGKSTLLTQVSGHLASKGAKVLYVSGEESAAQIKLRATRLGVGNSGMYLYPETDMPSISQAIDDMQPDYVIIDSVQTMNVPEMNSAVGSVSQIREVTAELMKIAKTEQITIFIVGHVTKEGAIAGPKILEHMVDTVLYFEGDMHHTYRMIRSVKNRYGSTNEIGIFEMHQDGLEEVANLRSCSWTNGCPTQRARPWWCRWKHPADLGRDSGTDDANHVWQRQADEQRPGSQPGVADHCSAGKAGQFNAPESGRLPEGDRRGAAGRAGHRFGHGHGNRQLVPGQRDFTH